MIIRKITEDDIKNIRMLISVSFGLTSDETDEEYIRNCKADKSRRGRNFLNRYAAFDESGKLLASLVMNPYKAHFDGNVVKMNGIGGVASFPEYRSKGTVRACFLEAYEQMYQEGCAFSYLHGFSIAYYRKFGYAPLCETEEITAEIHRLTPCGTKGTYELVSGDVTGCQEVYEKICARLNMMAVRIEDDWSILKEKNCVKNPNYTYLYRDEKGIPKSYFTFQKTADGLDTIIDCSEIYFYDKEGFGAILDFAIKLKGNFALLRMNVPKDMNVDSLILEHARNAIDRKRRNNGMARTIDLSKVLENALYKGSGKVVFRVNDEHCTWNDGVWSLRFKDNRFVELMRTDIAPQAEMTVEVFTALILGRYDFSEAELIAGLTVYEESEDFYKVFYRKRAAMYEKF